MEDKIKKISFPSEEHEALKKQDKIVTTRVSADYDKFFVGDLVETPWKLIFKVVKRQEITDIKKHPFYSELTKDQIEFLSKYNKIAVLTLEKVDGKNTFYRITYSGVGIYEALKKHSSKEDWDAFLKSDAAKWLPKPTCEYKSYYESYFTELGYKTFMDKTKRFMDKVLDKEKIKVSKYVGIDLTRCVYKDKYQVVVDQNTGRVSTESYSETATEISGKYNEWFGEYMYHGSSSKFTTLEPQIRSNRTTSTTKPKIFFTPFKGFAGIFCIDQNDQLLSVFGGQYDKETVKVIPKELPTKGMDGNYDLAQFQQVNTNIAFKHNVREFKTKFTKRFVGYIHCVNTEKLIASGLQEHVFSGIPEYWYYKPVHVDKVEKVEIVATFEYDQSFANKVGQAIVVPEIATEALSDKVASNIVNDKVYHASPKKFDVISGKKSNTPNAKSSVFVSPFKHFASMFILDFQGIVDQIEEQIGKKHIKIDNFGFMEWNETPRSTTSIPSKVRVLVRTPENFKPFKGKATGYMYTIDFSKYRDQANMWSKAKDSDVEFTIHGDVKPEKCEQISYEYEVLKDTKQYNHAEESMSNIEPDTNPAVRTGLENFWDESKPVEYRGKMDVNGVEHLHFVHGDETNQALSVMVVHSRERKDNCGPVRVVYEFDKFLVKSTEEQTDLDVAAELLQEFNAGIEEFNHWVRSLVIKHLKDELNDEQVDLAVENMALENVLTDTVKTIFRKIGEFIAWFLKKLKDLWNYFFGKTQRATRALKAANEKINRHKNSNGFFNDGAFEAAPIPQGMVNALGMDLFLTMGFSPDAFNPIFTEILKMWAEEPQALYEEIFVKYSQSPTTHRWHPIVAFMPTGGPNSMDAMTFTKNKYKASGSMRDAGYDRDSVLIVLKEAMDAIEGYEKNSKLIASKGNVASEAARRVLEYQERTDVTEHEAMQMAKDIQELANFLQMVFKSYEKAYEFILEQSNMVANTYMKYMK